jgi:hypothetical protein
VSVDFFSFVVWMAPRRARRLVERLDLEKRVVEDIVDASGTDVFTPGAGAFLPRKVASLTGRRPASPDDFSTAYLTAVDGEGTLLDELGKSSRCVSTPNFPALVVVDRALAIPNGIALMRGQPVARLRSKAVHRLLEEWPKLLERVGGRKKAIQIVARYLDRWGNGPADSTSVIDAISFGAERAAADEDDLVLVSMLVP